jgi:hypothetical protein
MPCHTWVEGFTYLTTRRTSSYHRKLAILSYQSIGCMYCQTYPYAVQQLSLSANSWRKDGTGLYCLFCLHYTKTQSIIFHTSHTVWLILRRILALVRSSMRPPRSFRNGISWVKTAFPQNTVGQLFETIWRAEKLTVEKELPEDSAKHQNTSEY